MDRAWCFNLSFWKELHPEAQEIQFCKSDLLKLQEVHDPVQEDYHIKFELRVNLFMTKFLPANVKVVD
jgi:hypothetical protein